MSEQWYNCILQRKIDGKEIEALYENGVYTDMAGKKLAISDYNIIEAEADYDENEKIPVFDDEFDIVWFRAGFIFVIGVLMFFGAALAIKLTVSIAWVATESYFMLKSSRKKNNSNKKI